MFEAILYTVSITIFIASLIRLYMLNARMCKSKNRLDGKVVIITGANTGIGYETAVDLAKRGATVVMACRDVERGRHAAERASYESNTSNCIFERLDLSSLSSIRQFVENFRKNFYQLDILINNAGVAGLSYQKTKDGFEMHFGVMHLGHFCLTNLLLDLLKSSKPSRVINVSALGHKGINMNWDDLNSEKKYSMLFAYAQSKLANILFTTELARRFKDDGIIAVSVDPGPVETDIWRNFKSFSIKGILFRLAKPIFWMILKNVKQGAQTTIHCAVDDSILKLNGKYFSDCHVATPSSQSQNIQSAEKLWKISEKLVGLSND